MNVSNSKHKTEQQFSKRFFVIRSHFFCAIVIFGILSIEHGTISGKKQKVNEAEINECAPFMELRMHKNEGKKQCERKTDDT